MEKPPVKENAKKILDEALQLEPTTRAFIAETLLESLDFEEDIPISQEWLKEIQRRCKEIDSGKAKLIDHETVIAELRGKYG